jgi:hypothetical protein
MEEMAESKKDQLEDGSEPKEGGSNDPSPLKDEPEVDVSQSERILRKRKRKSGLSSEIQPQQEGVRKRGRKPSKSGLIPEEPTLEEQPQAKKRKRNPNLSKDEEKKTVEKPKKERKSKEKKTLKTETPETEGKPTRKKRGAKRGEGKKGEEQEGDEEEYPEAETIIGITDVNGTLEFLLKFKAKSPHKYQLVPKLVVNRKWPQLALDFYEKRLLFKDNETTNK